MKITSFYYIEYPDCLPPDPMIARSEVYVEVAFQNGDLEHFDETYSIIICTIEFIRQHLKSKCFYATRSLIIVEKFEDKVIKQALEAILPDIESIGIKK